MMQIISISTIPSPTCWYNLVVGGLRQSEWRRRRQHDPLQVRQSKNVQFWGKLKISYFLFNKSSTFPWSNISSKQNMKESLDQLAFLTYFSISSRQSTGVLCGISEYENWKYSTISFLTCIIARRETPELARGPEVGGKFIVHNTWNSPKNKKVFIFLHTILFR